MWGSRGLHGDWLHGVQRGRNYRSQIWSAKEQQGAAADQHAGKARFKGGDRAHMAPAAIKEQHADQHARKARIRGFMGSYGVTLFSRPSAYIYIHVPALMGIKQ